MIVVINYGAGNLPNVVRALQHVGATIDITEDPQVVLNAQAVVLPGVGATRDTMQSLENLGMAAVLPRVIERGTPFLGICVGMQVLCRESTEFGKHACLDIIPGCVERFPEGNKIPQIGWNEVQYTDHARSHPLFNAIPDRSHFYFVHSYYCNLTDSSLIAGQTDYGIHFPSVLIRDNLAATQFHPEKSGRHGLQLLHNFVTIANEWKSYQQ